MTLTQTNISQMYHTHFECLHAGGEALVEDICAKSVVAEGWY